MAEPFTDDPDEVAGRWRPLTVAEVTVATKRLADAEALLLARVPSIPDRVTAGTLSSAIVQQVQVDMVLRLLKNPEGVRSRTESIDDYSTTEVRDQVLSAGVLYVTDEELALLIPSGLASVGTIRLGTSPWACT